MTELPHGHSKYTNERCRCPVCAAANSEYHREYKPGWRRMVVEAAKPLPSSPPIKATPSITCDEGNRFVVRSVTGGHITPESANIRGIAFGTSYTVLDSLDCYRIVYSPPRTSDGRANMRGRLLSELAAGRLNAEHQERMALER